MPSLCTRFFLRLALPHKIHWTPAKSHLPLLPPQPLRNPTLKYSFFNKRNKNQRHCLFLSINKPFLSLFLSSELWNWYEKVITLHFSIHCSGYGGCRGSGVSKCCIRSCVEWWWVKSFKYILGNMSSRCMEVLKAAV